MRALRLALLLALALLPELALAQGRYRPVGAAGRHFNKAEKLEQQGDALRDDGRPKEARARYQEAIDALLEARDADPAYIDVYARLGRLYYTLDRYPDALPLLEQGLQRDARDQALRFWYGQNLLKAGRGDEALKVLERLAGETDQFPEVYVVLGNHHYEAGHFERAAPAYEQYLRLVPDALDARARLGNTWFKLKKYAQALAEFERVIEQRPDDILTRINAGIAHYWLHQYDQAVAVLEAALKERPDRGSALFHLAQSYFEQRRYDAALPHYRRFIELAPKSFNGHYFAGSTLMELGRTDEALKALREASRLKPKIAHPHYKMGLLMLRAGDAAAAEQHLQKALALEPEEPWILSALGTAARQREDLDGALRYHRQAVARAGDKARLHANLALTLLRAGQAAEAAAAADEALRLDAADEWVRQAGATVLAAAARAAAGAGQPEEAEAAITRALSLRPQDAALLADRALLRAAGGRAAEALADAQQAVERAPGLVTAWYALGRARLAGGDAAGAIEALNKAWGIEPRAGVAASLGAALITADRIDEAVAKLDEAAERWPADPTLQQGRAAAHYLRGGQRLGRGVTAHGDLKIAQRNEDALDALAQARLHYALLVVSLRRGEGGEARGHHTRMQSAAYNARKEGLAGNHLRNDAPPGHTDALAAHANLLLGNLDQAMDQLTTLQDRKKRLLPYEARLLREVYDRLGVAALKKGNLALAAKHLEAAQKLEARPDTDNNLQVIAWRRGKKKPALARWKALRDEVPEAIFNYAAALEEQGDHEEAWREYGRYLRTGGPYAEQARELREAKQRIFKFAEEAP